MPAYYIAEVFEVTNPDDFKTYSARVSATVEKYGGRYLARGTAAKAYEAGQKERIVMSEFPSVEKAIAAYESPAYQNALKALGDGAVRDIRIVEGVD